ncbi:MAG TPA: two-component regulator propeller domain-containing protein [Flavitalea sp.]|nr:two-component regulator propeller domain-containing protein [Flavitalea sp.]
MRKFRSCGLLLLFLPYGHLCSQQVFEHITTAHGLSNNVVNSILQDKEGFYWIGTVDGLNRFDGSDFKIFRNEKNSSYSLAHNLCNDLLEDNEGNIWVATYNGISVYKKNEGRFKNIYLQYPDFKPDILNRIGFLAKDGDGNIWIGGQLLARYDIRSSTLQYYPHRPKDNTSISDSSTMASLLYDKKNNGVWVMTSQYLNFFDAGSKQFFHKKNNPRKWKVFEVEIGGRVAIDNNGNRLWFYHNTKRVFCYLDLITHQIEETRMQSHHNPRSVQFDEQNRLWVSFWKDVQKSLRLDPVSGIADSNFLNKFHSRSALSPRFNDVSTDKFKNIWIGSNKGISIYNPSHQFFELYELDFPFEKNADPFSIVTIAPSGPDGLWVGCSRKGLYHFNKRTRAFTKISELGIDKPISHLYIQGDSVLWASSVTTLYKIYSKSKKIASTTNVGRLIQFVTSDNDGHLWVGDWTSGLYKLNSNGKVMRHYVHEAYDRGSLPANSLICAELESNNLWVGLNEGNGFARYDFSKDRFVHYNPRTNDSSNKEFGTISSIATADGNSFLLGTHGGGVYLWDRNKNEYKQFTENDGIDGSFINSVLADKNGNYWVSTSNGVNFFDTKSQKFRPIKIDFSFSTNAFRGNGEVTGDGALLMFCANKLLEIKPWLYKSSEAGSKTLIGSFKVFDKDLSSSLSESVIRLTYKQNFFSFEYSVLKSNPEADARYAYKLEGFDKSWNDAGTRRYAAYTNVPTGSYRFMVKAANEKGEWSEAITGVNIVISPPFWKTWWFYVLAGLSVAAFLYFLYSYRINQLKKLMAVRARISQDLHDEVGAALSSIHVYSSVASKAMDKDTQRAKEALTQINQNTRQVMENMGDIVWAINIGDAGDTSFEAKVKNYGYELLTPLNIQCIYWIDKDVDKRLVNIEARKNVLLIVKEAMNNIAKYSEATEAMVKLEFRNKSLRLEIADNGRGFNEGSNRSGNGLHNMRKRSESLGGSFELSSEKSKGTILRFAIPITNISD